MPGEEASLAVPPPVLTLGVNRNIKSLLGGQETGNNQNTVSCPRPGHRAACHRPSTAARGFPSLASTQAAALGLVRPQWPTPQGTILRLPEKLAAMLRPQAAPPPRCHHWAGHPPALRPQGSGVGRREGPRGRPGGLGACTRCPFSASRTGAGSGLAPSRGPGPVSWARGVGAGGKGGVGEGQRQGSSLLS